jgi:hypothetical protein
MSDDRYTETDGWRAHCHSDFLRNVDRLSLTRPVAPGRLEVFSFGDGYPVMTIIDREGAARSDGGVPVLALPYGAIAAIAALARPGPSSGELGRLEEALRVERDRVDRFLQSITGPP